MLKSNHLVGCLGEIIKYYRPCLFVLAAAVDLVTSAIRSAVRSPTVHLIGPLAVSKGPTNLALSVSPSISDIVFS